MLLLLPYHPGLTLCRESPKAFEVGDLAYLIAGELLASVVRVDEVGAWVGSPTGYDWPPLAAFLSVGWREYFPPPPLLVRMVVAPGGESFAIGWAASRKVVTMLDTGEEVPAVFLRAVTDDRHPGVVVCEYRRVAGKVGV